MSQKRKQPPSDPLPGSSPDNGPIYTSTPIHDRASKFLALFSTSQTYLSNPRLLQQHTSLAGCMHRILAWRKASSQTSLSGSGQIFSTFSDEDGEKWAGKRVEKVLSEASLEGVCVVGRWYGGVMLGPVRFEHIERCVREAIELWRTACNSSSSSSSEPGVKRTKVDAPDDERVKQQLIQTLKDRDESVRVLRGLLVEKQQSLARLQHGKDGGGEIKQSSPAKVQASYDVMDVARLRTQEKARDATLTWILRQIEGVEKEIESIPKTEVEDVLETVVGDSSGGDGRKTGNGTGNGSVDNDKT